jgi:hypothetical protein
MKQIIKNVYMHKVFIKKIKYFHIWAIKAEKITMSLHEKSDSFIYNDLERASEVYF